MKAVLKAYNPYNGTSPDNSTEPWQWVPASCMLPPTIDAVALCRRKSLVFVGDSMTFSAYMGLVFSLSRSADTTCAPATLCGMRAEPCHAQCSGPCGATTIAYVRNDFLCCADGVNSLKINISTWRPQFDLRKLWSGAEPLVKSGSTVVIGTGQWWTWKLTENEQLRGSSDQVVESIFLATVGRTLSLLVAKVGSAGRVVLRLDFPGHHACNASGGPNAAGQPLSSYEAAEYHGRLANFGAQKIFVLNHLAAAECARHATCHTLDVSHLSALRPDDHSRPMGSNTDGNVRARDCVHYRASGGVVHAWSRVLAVLLEK